MFANIFSYSVSFLLTLFMVCFAMQKLLSFFFFQDLYCSITALQWGVTFCFIKSETAIHIHISPYHLPLASPSPPRYATPRGGHKAPSWSPCAMRLLPTSYLTFGSVYTSSPLSHFIPDYPSPSLCAQIHSLCLYLYSCPAPRFVRTSFSFFLDSIYMR